MTGTDAEAYRNYGWYREIETYVGDFKDQAEGTRKVYVTMMIRYYYIMSKKLR